MLHTTNATIADVENALVILKAAVKADASVEAKAGKKLAAAIEFILPKSNVTKDLNQAYNHGESWWAKNVLNGQLEGCTTANKLDKIKQYVCQSSSYIRHTSDSGNKENVQRWLADKFPVAEVLNSTSVLVEGIADEEKEAA